MNYPAPSDPYQNPFSTRYVRPGAAKFLFPPGEDAGTLVERLERSAWRGQIVGPHGSGKSSLVAALLTELKSRGRRPLLIALHDGERHLPIQTGQLSWREPNTIVIVDGYEQLSWWSRCRLRWLCQGRGWGLLATAHRSVGLPLLAHTSASTELAQQIVEQLLPADSLIGRIDIAQRFAAHGGNLREMLFDLYDLYESRRGQGRLPGAD